MKSKNTTKEILELTKELIKFESTVSQHKELERIIDFCAAYFKGSDFFIKKYRYKHNPALVVLTKKTKRPKILLAGHLDVVPAEKSDFKPYVKAGKLFGRGAADMKAACAVMMRTMQALTDRKNRSVGLILTTDEETGHYNGTAYLTDKVGYRAQVVLLPDGGNDFQLVTAQKGVMKFSLIAKGLGAHGSRPWLGESAVEKIFEAYEALRRAFPMPKAESDWRPSITLTKISGGEAFNKVPSKAEAVFDFRFIESHSIKYWLSKIEHVARKHGLEMEVGGCFEVFSVDPEDTLVKRFRQISKSVLRKELVLAPEAGASDATYFSKHHTSVIITSPKSGNSHAANEWVDINSLYKFYQIVHKFAEEVG